MTDLAIDEIDPPEERLLADVLSEFTRTMPPDSSIQAILDHLVQRIIELLPVSEAGVTLVPRGSDQPLVAASNAVALGYEQLQRNLDEGPGVLSSASGEPVAAPDLRDDKRFPTFGPRASSTGLGAMFTFPLRQADHRLGALDLFRGAAGSLSPTAMNAAQTVADVVSAHLMNAHAREDHKATVQPPRQISLRDALTGLPNRTLMLDRLDLALLRIQRSGRSAAVIWVDLDLSGKVGIPPTPLARDEILVAAALRLRGLLRRTDTLARIADTVFAILCEGMDTPDQAVAIVARLATAMNQPFEPGRTGADASIGVAWVGDGQRADALRSPEQLLQDAYLARAPAPGAEDRRAGDEHCQVELGDLADDLEQAQARGEFHVEYQPILATSNDRVAGFEALLRWIHPTRGAIAPATFIPLAERSGLINQLGGWVLLQACADRRRWQAAHPGADLSMAVNISVHQLMSPGFTASVAAVLAVTNADPRLLTLEITESVFIRDGERALVVLGELKALGVRLALDDFGTGYSSLSYLKRFSVQILKIDQAFIVDLAGDAASRSIVAAIVNLAHDLGMTVIAEGVETAAQRDEVSRLGCDYYQGYFFARPTTAPGDDPAAADPSAPGSPATLIPIQQRSMLHRPSKVPTE